MPLASRLSPSESGVALVITVVMISIITFLAVAFLTLTGRERGSVRTATDSTMARNAADVANERAKAEIIGAILATTNIANIDLLVSTNFVNWTGFDPAAVVFNQLTNVNYEYLDSGTLGVPGATLNLGQSRQNLTNLFFNPRPPVYITNRLTGGYEFRYYIDLNRNGRFENTGRWPVTNFNYNGIPGLSFFDTNGNSVLVFDPSNLVSNYVTGDPQWIGGLDRADKTHSADNQFLYRYAYIVVPEGKTMDINYIHNSVLTTNRRNMNAFGQHYSRNQGVGTWEINLAAFLTDLNTNEIYGWGNDALGNGGYNYNPLTGVTTAGRAFADAFGFYRYQLNGIGGNLNYSPQAFGITYGGASATLFRRDQVDGYSDGPLQTGINYVQEPPVGANPDNTQNPWVGANRQHQFFTTQDFYNPAKANRGVGGFQFTDRLFAASTNVSTYDQTTFYRMLAQLGTDSATEDEDKLNLNYVNVGGLKVTNFVSWTDSNAITAALGPNVSGSVLFFTNSVDRLLKAYTTEWLAADKPKYTNFFKTDKAFGVDRIPVYVSNQFVYPPAVNRILQMAANVWDSRANRRDAFGELPTVFQPLFTNDSGNIYINGFREATTLASLQTTARPILDLTASTNLPSIVPEDLIYGVPLVIGARKNLPNFNEFSMESNFLLTRKVELRKSGLGGRERINQTNQFFTMALTMPSAAEFWNSYSSNYNRKVFIYVTNRTTMTLTNDLGIVVSNTFVTAGFVSDPKLGVAYWPSYRGNDPKNESFVVTMRTNVPFLPLTGYLPNTKGTSRFVSATNENVFDTTQNLLAPTWGVSITNRVSAMIVEQGTGRIIDFVLLGNLTSYRDLSAEFGVGGTGTGDAFAALWTTNVITAGVTGRKGVEAQIRISRGAEGSTTITDDNWKPYGNFNTKGYTTVTAAIEGFNKFFRAESTLLKATVPFSPSINYAMPMTWQANDPLVHYISSELFYIAESGLNNLRKIDPPVLTINMTNTSSLGNIGKKNKRYLPWATEPGAMATDPDAFNTSIKDPLVRSSDEWDFPTNNFATVGWLGRIHRGTPWQTIYLKSSNVGLTNIVSSPSEWAVNVVYKPAAEKWANWTGNATLEEGYYSRPVTDRVLFDVFTTALNENSTRGQLPINQTNLAAWSAVFAGMVALTNQSSEVALSKVAAVPQYAPIVIQPAGLYNAFDTTTWSPMVKLVDGINRTRANKNYFANGTFNHLGDILAVPELTDASPFLNQSGTFIPTRGINDAAYEWLPQQVMSLLQVGKPRFAIYAYGQALQPAPNSIVTAGGAFFGLCTNYAITSEVATRTVVEIEGGATAPRVVTKSYNILGPD